MTTKNQPLLDVPQLVQEAHERCQEHLSPTPLEYSLYLSEKIKGDKILSLTEAELDKGIVTASTGNYALAVAEAMRIRKRRATIYVAEDIDPSRLALLRAHGLDLDNDPILVGGQGTCGHEISKQLPDLNAALFACGAGGLLTWSVAWI